LRLGVRGQVQAMLDEVGNFARRLVAVEHQFLGGLRGRACEIAREVDAILIPSDRAARIYNQNLNTELDPAAVLEMIERAQREFVAGPLPITQFPPACTG
jgi:hypothetical protein